MARHAAKMDPSPVAAEEGEEGDVQNLNKAPSLEAPYAEYRVCFYTDRVQAEVVSGLARLSPGKVQRSLRFLFKEIYQQRRRLQGSFAKRNEEEQDAFKQEVAEKEQTNVR